MILQLAKRYTLLICSLALVPTGVTAAAERPAAAQDWEATVKRAEEEGQVAVYATDSIGSAQVIWAAFQKRYPKIKFAGTTMGRGSDLFPSSSVSAGPEISRRRFPRRPLRHISQSLQGQNYRTGSSGADPPERERPVEVVAGKTPLHRSGRPIHLHVRRRALRRADLF